MPNPSYTIVGPDSSNPDTHVIIEADGKRVSCFIGTEALTASELLGIAEP